MRVVVTIPESHRELRDELDTFSSRSRAGRLLLLASQGLKNQQEEPPIAAKTVELEQERPAEAMESARAAIRGRLMGGF